MLLTPAWLPGRYVFAFRIPYLPDLQAAAREFGVGTLQELYSRQLSFLRALAAYTGGSCSLQLRFLSAPGTNTPMDMCLLGSAISVKQGLDLIEMVTSFMPTEVPLIPIDEKADLEATWFPLRTRQLNADTFAEIRRAIEPLDPDPLVVQSAPHDLVLLDWAWSANSLTNSLEFMQRQRGTTLLGITVAPAWVEHESFLYLTEGVKFFQGQLKTEWENPLVRIARDVYFDRARRLRQAALNVRVFMASDEKLIAGAPEFFGSDLSRRSDASGLRPPSFGVVRPIDAAAEAAAAAMLYRLESPVWGVDDDVDEGLRALIFLYDPVEAHVAFRVPLAPAAGIAGVAVSPTSSLNRSWQHRDPATISGPQVRIGQSPVMGDVTLSHADVNEHVVVAGVPGSGKSTTVRQLLRQLSAQNVPFLVLDPAKSDYRALGDIAQLISLRPEEVGFNPLAVPRGASPRGHQARILAALDSGLRLSERWPLGRTIAALALAATYQRAGQDGTWPTIADFYRITRQTVIEQGYSKQISGDIQASLVSRLELLLDGPLGSILSGDSASSIDWDLLTNRNVVIEMRQVAGSDERNLVFGFLFASLVGYREAHPLPGLGHVTVLEEAHRIVGATSANSSNTSLFSEAIAELRGSGESFVIVDQAPSTLIPAVSKNTGTKMSHRLLDAEEVNYVGDAMMLSPIQRMDIARLSKGRALVSSGSLLGAVLVEVEPEAKDESDIKGAAELVAGTVVRPTENLRAPTLVAMPGQEQIWCSYCPAPCMVSPTKVALTSTTPPPQDILLPGGLERFVKDLAATLHVDLGSRNVMGDMRVYCLSAYALINRTEVTRDHPARPLLKIHKRVWGRLTQPPGS